MKLLRYGEKGREKPAILDKNGKHGRMTRDLAALCPAVPEVQAYYKQLTEKFIREWGFDGSKLVLNSAGQRYEIAVPSNTEVLKQVPATLNALAPGVRVLAAGTPAADGTLNATSISIMGAPAQ